ncbi:MAG: ATP-binding cassette domain-containing protein, partial [Gemmatimonadaceae bacterium]
MPDASAVLSASGVTKRYGDVRALDGITLAVAAGECVALVGESGSGKTTLLRCFNRLVEPENGNVQVRERDIRDLDPVTLRRQTGYVPQEGGLLPHWSVLRNVELVPWLGHAPDARALALEALSLVG